MAEIFVYRAYICSILTKLDKVLKLRKKLLGYTLFIKNQASRLVLKFVVQKVSLVLSSFKSLTTILSSLK